MKFICPQLCEVCGRGKGGGFRGINHDKCAKVLREKAALQKKKTTTRRFTDQQIDHFSRAGK